jgi:hypothetical protein
MKCLFVGGDYDGEILDVDSKIPEIRLTNKPAVTSLPYPLDSRSAPWTVLSYRRERFVDKDEREYFVYLFGNPAQPLRMLLNGYSARMTVSRRTQ